jgi:hypothetical protein
MNVTPSCDTHSGLAANIRFTALHSLQVKEMRVKSAVAAPSRAELA